MFSSLIGKILDIRHVLFCSKCMIALKNFEMLNTNSKITLKRHESSRVIHCFFSKYLLKLSRFGIKKHHKSKLNITHLSIPVIKYRTCRKLIIRLQEVLCFTVNKSEKSILKLVSAPKQLTGCFKIENQNYY